jgi:hypothetical protein
VREKIFINADLTKAESTVAYEERCHRRQLRQTRSSKQLQTNITGVLTATTTAPSTGSSTTGLKFSHISTSSKLHAVQSLPSAPATIGYSSRHVMSQAAGASLIAVSGGSTVVHGSCCTTTNSTLSAAVPPFVPSIDCQANGNQAAGLATAGPPSHLSADISSKSSATDRHWVTSSFGSVFR